jgi:hypothetical protein
MLVVRRRFKESLHLGIKTGQRGTRIKAKTNEAGVLSGNSDPIKALGFAAEGQRGKGCRELIRF